MAHMRPSKEVLSLEVHLLACCVTDTHAHGMCFPERLYPFQDGRAMVVQCVRVVIQLYIRWLQDSLSNVKTHRCRINVTVNLTFEPN